MDLAALTELKSRCIEAIAAAERYRDLADRAPALRSFYHALAVTHERSAREMTIMHEKAERVNALLAEAA